MAEPIRTNDVALISVVEGLLQQADIPCHVADRHASVIGGTLGLLQMRVWCRTTARSRLARCSPTPSSGSG